jgi:hypothetical protein
VRADRREVVITGGLQPGDRICVSDLESVVEGMSVRVRGEAASEPKTDEHDAA